MPTTKVATRPAGFPFHTQKNICSLDTSFEQIKGQCVAIYLHHVLTGETQLIINNNLVGKGMVLPIHLEKPLIDKVLELHQDCLNGLLIPKKGKIISQCIFQDDLPGWKIPPAQELPYRELRIIG